MILIQLYAYWEHKFKLNGDGWGRSQPPKKSRKRVDKTLITLCNFRRRKFSAFTFSCVFQRQWFGFRHRPFVCENWGEWSEQSAQYLPLNPQISPSETFLSTHHCQHNFVASYKSQKISQDLKVLTGWQIRLQFPQQCIIYLFIVESLLTVAYCSIILLRVSLFY